jgi:hypothetical protein
LTGIGGVNDEYMLQAWFEMVEGELKDAAMR